MNSDNSKKIIYICILAIVFICLFTGTFLGAFDSTEIIWLEPVLYAILFIAAGVDAICETFENLLEGRVFCEEFLMLVAGIAAFIVGEYEEAAAVMILYDVGEFFEDFAVDRSKDSIAELMDISAKKAFVLNDGAIIEKTPEQVDIGSIIVVRPGEKIPIDGEVVEGDAFVDNHALTGESVPVHVKQGDPVYGGGICDGLLKVRTCCEYAESAAEKIVKLVKEAENKKGNTEKFVDRFASIYTPAVTLSAIAMAVIGALVTGDYEVWIGRACTFLVISCPCAIVLSIPLCFFAGMGAASRKGILVKGSTFIEGLAKMKMLGIDKTGTVTKGEFEVTEAVSKGKFDIAGTVTKGVFEVTEAVSKECTDMLELAGSVEAFSKHPAALAIVRYCNKSNTTLSEEVSDYKEQAGLGVSATVRQKHVIIGNERFIKMNGICGINSGVSLNAGTVCHVAADNEYLGYIVISDSIKEKAADAIELLKNSYGIRTVMLTGDNSLSAAAVAESLPVYSYSAGLMPVDKVNEIEKMKAEIPGDGTVAFAGDGINDAPVLKMADVGIAMGMLGSDAAVEAADVVIMDDGLMKIADAVSISKNTMKLAKENIIFALAVKFVILVTGIFGIAGMWAAVFADVGVALLTILNSLRILRVKKAC